MVMEKKAEAPLGGAGGEPAEAADAVKGFFACYLLVSSSPRHKGHTYIGFTVNPRRRIRQHNGEIRCGAWRTKRGRPWEMVLCIYGFPTNVSALQFEWAWQHPLESLAVRKAAATFKSLSGVANKIKLAFTMLTLPAWESLNLTVNFFSTKYIKYKASCPGVPKDTKVAVRTMDELPCYLEGYNIDGLGIDDDDGEDEETDLSGRHAISSSHEVLLSREKEAFPQRAEEECQERPVEPLSSPPPCAKSLLPCSPAGEVIDLLTPTSCKAPRRQRSLDKLPLHAPEIIDLTCSPIGGIAVPVSL